MAQEPKRPIRSTDTKRPAQSKISERRGINNSGKAVTTSAVLTPKRPGNN